MSALLNTTVKSPTSVVKVSLAADFSLGLTEDLAQLVKKIPLGERSAVLRRALREHFQLGAVAGDHQAELGAVAGDHQAEQLGAVAGDHQAEQLGAVAGDPEPYTVRALQKARDLSAQAVGGPLAPEIEDATRQRLGVWEAAELRRLEAGVKTPAPATFLNRLAVALAACRLWLPVKGTCREVAPALSYETQRAVLARVRFEEGEERRALLDMGVRDPELFALLEAERVRAEYAAKKALQRQLPAGASLSKVRQASKPDTS